MEREPNTDVDGRPFIDEVIEAVWNKGRSDGISETLRLDAWGWRIVKQDFGNTRSRYGWEVDHIIPVALGGTDDLVNLQPLQWENNRRKDEIQGTQPTQPLVKPQSGQGHPGTGHSHRGKKH